MGAALERAAVSDIGSHGEQSGVGRAGGADGDRRHGHTFRHLYDRQQRIEPVERLALDRHADDRQHRLRRHHARQVGRPARARDNHLEAPLFR